MLWRPNWSLLNTIRKVRILETRGVSSLPSMRFEENERTHVSFSCKNRGWITLTPEIVHSTLVNCQSDLIALSFFVWCAKQDDYFHDKRAFGHMVGVVSRLTNRYRTVRGVVRKLESVGVVVKAKTFLLLLRIYWLAGLYSMVFETFEEMSSFGFTPNTFARNVVMDVLFKIGRPEVGLKVLRETQWPGFLSYSTALCNLCKYNDMDNIRYVLRVMLRKGYYPNVNALELVLDCYLKAKRLVEAYQVLGLMVTLGISLSVKAWSMLIHGLCLLQQPVMASTVLDRMLRSDSSPSIVTYTTLFKGFMESEMISEAFDVFSAMRLKGCAPDIVLCNALINSLSKIGRYDDALDIFLGLPDWKLIPDSYTISALLSTICSSRKFSLLPQLVSGLTIEGDLVVYNSLINYFYTSGTPSLALDLYNLMLSRGFHPDNYTFVGLLRVLCEVRGTGVAVNVYREMVMNHSSLDAYVHTVIINKVIESGKYNLAIDLFTRAVTENYPLDVVSYIVVIRGLIKCERIPEAYGFFKKMKATGLSPNAYLYKIMLNALCRQRHTELVQSLLEEIIAEGIHLDHYTLVRLTELMFRSKTPSSFSSHVLALWKTGLNANVKIGDASHSLLEISGKDNLIMESYSSDDISDVAASVG